MDFRERHKDMARTIRALGHPTRIFIMERLREKEHCVGELQALIGSDISTLSRHLSVLRNARIVACRRENNQVFYRLLCNCVFDVYECLTQLATSRVDEGISEAR